MCKVELSEVENEGDSVKLWVVDSAVFEAGYWTNGATLYTEYKKYCIEAGLQAMARPRFTSALCSRYDVKQQLKKIGGKVQRGILGIRLREDGDPDPVTPGKRSRVTCLKPHQQTAHALQVT